MPEEEPSKWRRLPRPNFSRKNVSKRMRKVEGVTIKHTRKFVLKRWSNVLEVQRRVFIWLFVIGLLIASTGLQLMWYEQSYKVDTAASDTTYAEAILGPIETLNPLFASTNAEQSASYLMFSRLMNYDTTGHLSYDLVKDIKINDKKTVYTVTIRPDAKWHDGEPLSADDVAFTIDLMKDPILRTSYKGWDNISYKILSKYSIEFSLNSTFAAFEHALTFPVLPKHILNGVVRSQIRESKFSKNPIGSGPFRRGFIQQSDQTSGSSVIYMARNDSYYGKVPKLSLFQLHVYATTDEIVKAIANKEISSAIGLPFSDLERIKLDGYNVTNNPIYSGVYSILNTKSELLKDINVRRALQLGTNTAAIRKELASDTPSIDLPFTNTQLYGDVPHAASFNQPEANKILDTNGWQLNDENIRVKDGKELKLSVVTIKNSDFERVLEVLVGQWRALGFNIETQVLDTADDSKGIIQNVIQPRSYDVLLYQLNIGADLDVYAYWHSSQASINGFNFSNYSNSISDDALSSARSRLELDLRNVKYITFAKQWLADVPAIGLYQTTFSYVSSKTAHTFDKSNKFVTPVDRFSDISEWSAGNKKVYKTP